AAICFVLWRDRRMLLSPGNFVVLTVLFLVALSLYLYLPIRTNAGAAIHWGDPNTFEKFVAHVTGRSHREVYFLQQNFLEYFHRTNQALSLVGAQLGFILVIGIWGLIRLRPHRWQLFFVLVIVFDFVYTVFLNVISLKVTPFALPTLLCLAILSGLGIAQALHWVHNHPGVGGATSKLVRASWCFIPAIPLALNITSSDQSSNCTAYEHALNALRTPDYESILLVEGDNHFFPVVYARIAEKMRPDLLLFDRHNILYEMPYVGEGKGLFVGKWEEYRRVLEKEIARRMLPLGIYYLTFVPDGVTLPGEFQLVPAGILHKVERKKGPSRPYRIKNAWRYYSTESFYEDFEKDFMTRQVQSHFFLRHAQYLFFAGKDKVAQRQLKNASVLGYDDSLLLSKASELLMDNGYYEEARIQLERALENKPGDVVNNSWGVYYYKKGEYRKAAEYFEKALELKPRDHFYLRNLGLALYRAGEKREALKAMRESLTIKGDQPDLLELIAQETEALGAESHAR
ncbi:MAG: tetratricopeptide repeat protein, partial [Deltaproteobacteria bacterium]|nr:tetratricopeptide repeat protein [Deltaproteobacteria bacterium]